MIQSETLVKGQNLLVKLETVQDRLPKDLIKQLTSNPLGRLVGYKMVDGNSFGLVLELSDGTTSWFFEHELDLAIEE